ncbi:hypothetical protein CDAR_612591 [Caerostris darwini]|uniref:Uncharacterized protein n=1 Tax=Caerostris darwini TaxID=1538125 RepID=A0AAV4SME9_9ARAC|nr:hypothetical protein CDAR_612591 [Caerostris darwini]
MKRHAKKFLETGFLGIKAGKRRNAVSEVTTVEFDDTETSCVPSARAVARQTDTLYATVWKISWKMLRFYPYKIGRVQELKMADYEKRWTFPNGNQ